MLSKNAEFTSERLTYRGINSDDADLIVAWRSDPDIYKYLFRGRPLSLNEHLEWYSSYKEDDTRYDFMIFDQDGKPIGTVGLTDIDGDKCDIAYMIGDSSARGKGYAKEAIRAVSNLAFASGIKVIYARVLPFNNASIRTALSCGFEETETVFKLVCPNE